MTTKLFIDDIMLDFFNDEEIIYTQTLKNIKELSGTFGSFSRQFTIPASPKNNELFDRYDRFDTRAFNPHQNINVKMIIDDIYEISGNLEVKGVDYVDEKPKNYKIVFYSNQTNLKLLIGNTKLVDIDWTLFDTVLTYANVKASWLQTEPDVLFPIIGCDRDWVYGEANVADNIAIDHRGILLQEFAPALNLKKVIENVLSPFVDVTWETGLAEYLEKAYIQPRRTAGSMVFDLDVESYASRVNYPINFLGLNRINFTDVNKNGDGSYVNGAYTVMIAGDYIFNYQWVMSGSPPLYTARIRKNFITVEEYIGASIGIGDFVYLTYTATLEVGDIIDVIHFTSSLGGDIVEWGLFDTVAWPKNYLDRTLIIEWPDMFVIDFIKKFLDSMNLIITEAGLITPYQEYLTNSIDITRYASREFSADKIDLYSEVKLTHIETKAFNNTEFEAYARRKYGDAETQYDVINNGNTLDVKSPFTVFPPAFMDDLSDTGAIKGVTDLLIHKQIDENSKPVFNDFLLFYWLGVADVESEYYLQNDFTGGVETFILQDTFPLVSMTKDDIHSLTYSREYSASSSVPYNTISELFFNRYLENIYDIATRSLKVKAVLPIGLFLQIALSTEINLRGFKYRIDEYSYNFKTGETLFSLLSISAPVVIPPQIGYRADTTLLTADNTIITADNY